MRPEYVSHEYEFDDMTDSFQADLVDHEEQIDEKAFTSACLKSERSSLYFELGNPSEVAEFVRKANTFDARLIGIMNEWAVADDKAYARDGILLDGKTASQVMQEKGCSFMDIIGMVQQSLDDPGNSQFDKIQTSIGGPAFMTPVNVLDEVKEKGQLGRDRRMGSALGKIEQAAKDQDIQDKKDKNREELIAEKNQASDRGMAADKARKELEGLGALIEKEEQALQLFGEKAEKGMKPGEFTATFYMLEKDGEVHQKVTSNSLLAEHKTQYELLAKGEERKEHSVEVPRREKISLKDLEEPSLRKMESEKLRSPIQKERVLKKDGFQK